MTDCLIGILIVVSSPLAGVIASIVVSAALVLITKPVKTHMTPKGREELIGGIAFMTFLIAVGALILFGGAYAFGAFS